MTAIEEVFFKVGNDTITRLKAGLEKSNASFDLTQSIDYQVKTVNGGYIWSLSMNPYYTFVDKGRKAGKYAPVDAIREYVTSKGLKLKDNEKAKSKATALKPKASETPKNKAIRAKSGLSKSIKDRNTLAFLINRKLKEKGTKGNNFYSNVINTQWTDDFMEQLSEAGLQEMSIEFDLLIKA